MSTEVSLFASARARALKAYREAGAPFSATTKPYKSTQNLAALCYDSKNVLVASPGLPSGRLCYAVFPAQVVEFFTYGVGETRPLAPAAVLNLLGSPGVSVAATDADTTLSKPRQTNGSEDFIIEGISATHRATRLSSTESQRMATSGTADGLSAMVKQALEGFSYLNDGQGCISGAEAAGPSLEDILYQAVAPNASLEFEWVRQRVMKVGTLEQMPEGAGRSRLRAMGDANTANRFKVPEGLVWRRQGQQDSEFIARVRIETPIVVPFVARDTVADPGADPPVEALSPTPKLIALEVALRLHGLALDLPSLNF